MGADPGGSVSARRYWWHCTRGTAPADSAPVSGTGLGGSGPKVAILTAAGRGHDRDCLDKHIHASCREIPQPE